LVTAETRRERDFERFLMFVDAVVAIAITLLVLPLVDLAGSIHHGQSVSAVLGDHLGEIGSAVLSFVVIAQLWFAQHRVISNVVIQDPVVTRLMMVWLLAIVALPFPTSLLAQVGGQPITKVLYIGTMAVSGFALAGLARRVAGTPAIRGSADVPNPASALASAVTFLVALAISLAVPAASYWPLVLLIFAGPLADWVRNRRASPRRS
jgi:uncharacterized membrane protein